MLSTGSMEVEKECRMRARTWKRGERDAFRSPAFWILVWNILGRKKLGEECGYFPSGI